ncbi:MAG: ADP compounds hydrolase NudE [Aeromonadales bacterium]|nr:ADP compounds hydrolase NudE [Aeromonadales bacterium]
MDLCVLNNQLPKVLAKRRQKVSNFFTVDQLDLKFSNNKEMTYERLIGGNGAVLAVPFDGKDFLLTSEYACGFERYELGFVKGKIDNGEDPKEACNRELKEEIGFGAKKIRTLRNEMTVAPGMLQLRMYCYLCTDLYEMQLEGDEPEPINIVRVSPKEAKELIFSQDSPLTEARAIAALTLAMNKLDLI